MLIVILQGMFIITLFVWFGLIWGLGQMAMLSAYSWLSAQESVLMGLRGSKMCWISNSNWKHGRQMPRPLYYWASLNMRLSFFNHFNILIFGSYHCKLKKHDHRKSKTTFYFFYFLFLDHAWWCTCLLLGLCSVLKCHSCWSLQAQGSLFSWTSENAKL